MGSMALSGTYLLSKDHFSWATGLRGPDRVPDRVTDIIFYKPDTKNGIRVSLKDLTERLGQATCQALPFLHAFTGSDTTSAFKNIGKKKGYDILTSYEDALEIFSAMFMNPFQHLNVEMNEFKIMQRFVILMYSKSSEFTMVNAARQEMFFQKNSNLDIIPPTENALFQHCLRAIYQTGVWRFRGV